ncbi:hypothetical protein [uncultured Lactobacillus sp.]|uniref:hypothetical protein n=1 Tax=uncultured Lactobacillus sp. TaxID=153152 RepID=UPI00258ADD32|nr:hypothetical protein [uncultured Lactobacillus sp.]
MKDQQKGLIREYPNNEITIEMPDPDEQAELLDKLCHNLPPELRYPCQCEVNLEKDATSYPGLKIGSVVELEDDIHYLYGEVIQIKKKSFTFACFIVSKEDKQNLKEAIENGTL